jgi:O-acetyl-ADP-ribose deacetylase (regulator of RNase III)
VRSAAALAQAGGFASLAFPVIGAGSGGFDERSALDLMLRELESLDSTVRAVVVRFRPPG